MRARILIIVAFLISMIGTIGFVALAQGAPHDDRPALRVGVAKVSITPFGHNPDWHGTVTASGLWGEEFTDLNHNGRWDPGEPFTDDPVNSELDASSKGKWDGIYLAGFGHNRPATGMHDDIWARALVFEQGETRLAVVALDLIGYYAHADYYGLDHVKKLLDPELGITDILIASTHDHEAPDTIGPWGPDVLTDGKYPRYLQFIDAQIAKAIAEAARSTVPVRMKVGITDPQQSPSIAGMQTRTAGRPPFFFDQEMRVLQFFRISGSEQGRVVATLINWNTHPESMESGNTIITSDFPDAVRKSVEAKFGGTAVYISGDIGAVEIIGDSNNKNHDRINFDGRDFPLNSKNNRPGFTFERTEAIGRDVAKAAFNALAHAEWSESNLLTIRKATMRAPMDNAAYYFLAQKGVLDTVPLPPDGSQPVIEASVYDVTLGDAEIITVPGELFPEVFYGVDSNHRTDCGAADTGRPHEVSVRDRMKGKYKLIFGLCPDEFGYFVPGYDFIKPKLDLAKGALEEAKDPCKQSAHVPDHYHETNSASSDLAAAWSCTAAALLDGKMPDAPACQALKDHFRK